jgi:hypothetical protein
MSWWWWLLAHLRPLWGSFDPTSFAMSEFWLIPQPNFCNKVGLWWWSSAHLRHMFRWVSRSRRCMAWFSFFSYVLLNAVVTDKPMMMSAHLRPLWGSFDPTSFAMSEFWLIPQPNFGKKVGLWWWSSAHLRPMFGSISRSRGCMAWFIFFLCSVECRCYCFSGCDD